MTINLFDDECWLSLRPLTFTRPVADLRVGILTIAEKWAKYLNADFGFQTKNYLSKKYSCISSKLYINGSVFPDESLVEAIAKLPECVVLLRDNVIIAFKNEDSSIGHKGEFVSFQRLEYHSVITRIRFPEDIFRNNGAQLVKDFALLTKGKISATLSSTNVLLGNQIFVEEGATAECSTFNSLQGPIYLGKNSQVWEGSNIRGPFALGEESSVKMGSKIYPNTTIGMHSRVGGEINNAVIWGYSSKGHEGYLGNSVIGQWCNIGADSNNSNLKNNYAEVKLWDYNQEDFRKTGLQFCGLIMADHAKCGINTMFNTGTVVGVGANIFGAGFPSNFVPDFSWGGAAGFQTYRLDKMFETTQRVFERRNLELDEIEKEILTTIFENKIDFRIG